MYENILKELKDKMSKSVSVFSDEISKVRGGRASSSMVEDIRVAYYGNQTPIKQLAAINVTDPKTILIQPWDKNSLGDIENALRASDLNINPVNDGSNIRLNFPPLSEERRAELFKVVKSKAEDANVALKMLRQDAWKKVNDLESEKKITEDDRYAAEEELNKIVAQFKSEVEKILEKKDAELKEI